MPGRAGARPARLRPRARPERRRDPGGRAAGIARPPRRALCRRGGGPDRNVARGCKRTREGVGDDRRDQRPVAVQPERQGNGPPRRDRGTGRKHRAPRRPGRALPHPKERFMKRLLLLSAALAFAAPASAQFANPSFDQPDMTVDAATKKTVVDSLADRIEERYVFPDLGKTVAKQLRAWSKKGRYDAI